MNMNDTGNRVIAAIIVVLIVIGAWYLGTSFHPSTSSQPSSSSTSVNSSGTPSQQGTHPATTTTASSTITVGGTALSVQNQPAGSFVMVASVTLPQTGWVAIRDESGRTLGAGLFEAGTHEAVQVPLLRNTEAGQTYQALLYTDDGDRQFDLHKDTLVMNSDGTVAGTSFSAQNGD